MDCDGFLVVCVLACLSYGHVTESKLLQLVTGKVVLYGNGTVPVCERRSGGGVRQTTASAS